MYSTYLAQQNIPIEAKNLDWQIIDEIKLEYRVPYYSYKIRTAEFNIYHEDDDIGLARIEIYNNGKEFLDSKFIKATEYLNMFSNVLTLKYGDNYYIFLQQWTGGAHCCYPEYVFLLNKNNELKFIKELKFGDDSSFSRENFIEKNGNLYLKFTDSRFAYFYTYFTNSFFFNQYLLIDDNQFIVRNFDFKSSYLEEANICKQELYKLIQTQENYENLTFRDWSPVLTCKIVNYLIAGEEEKAWENLTFYFDKLPIIISDYEGEAKEEEFILEIKESMIKYGGRGVLRILRSPKS